MLIFDIETDGLLDTVTKVHCGCVFDTTMEEYTLYRPHEIEQMIDRLLKADSICGHNVIMFDIPVLERLYNVVFDQEKVIDTLVLARLVYSNISDIDAVLVRQNKLSSKLWGSHSLKAYGQRLGVLKGTYAEDTEDCWGCFNDEMLAYNKQDVVVTQKLYENLLSKGFTEDASLLEHKAQWLMFKMEQNGFPFNLEKAYELKAVLETERQKVEDELKAHAPLIPDKIFIPKRDNKKLGYTAGVPIQRYKEFNPTSRAQMKYIFEEHYKYQFQECMYDTKTGQLRLDEEALKHIETDEQATSEVRHIASLYKGAFLLSKRLGQLSEGKQAWLKLVGADGKIHGRCNPNGTVSGRASHSNPNVAQVPSANSPYGKECRELFGVPQGWYQAGIDCSGLELRCLAHYLYPYDHGEYAHEILNGDIHTKNQKNAGLETRSQAKTFIYGFLYGGGDAKIGEIVNGTKEDGKRLKEKFLKNTPALKTLQKQIKDKLSHFNTTTKKVEMKRNYLYGLDGRKLYVRSMHSALNLLLQSAGALICKQWIVRTEQRLLERGLKHGWDGDFVLMAWIHDEQQIACRTKEIAECVVYEAQQAVRDVGEHYGFRMQLDTEGKIGENWYGTH